MPQVVFICTASFRVLSKDRRQGNPYLSSRLYTQDENGGGYVTSIRNISGRIHFVFFRVLYKDKRENSEFIIMPHQPYTAPSTGLTEKRRTFTCCPSQVRVHTTREDTGKAMSNVKVFVM